MTTRTIAIAHHAGGVGKTTTALNLGFSLAQQDHSVLLVDLDPQGDLSLRLGVSYPTPSLATALIHNQTPDTTHPVWNGVSVGMIPSNLEEMAGLELELIQVLERERCLTRALRSYRDDYEYILIDCPPALNLLTINAFYAADEVLIPVQAQDKALRQLDPLLKTIEDVQGYRDGRPLVLGMLLTMLDGTRQAHEAERVLRETYPQWVCATTIPKATAARDDGRYHAPIATYAPGNSSALAYWSLAKELTTHAR